MSQISQKSITGITSITTPAGVDNQLTLHNNNTTEAVKLDVAGNLHFHNHLNITGVSTASNFKTGTSNLHNTGLNVQDLDVDGHTNLDNVSVVGVSTFTRVGATAVFNSGAANDGRLEFEYNSSRVGLLAYHSDRLEIQTDSSKDFTIRTNGANERFRITSGGDVGINTTAPQNSAHFQHYISTARHQSFQSTDGDLAIVSDNNTNPVVYVKGTGNADLVRLYDGSTQVVTVDDEGKVGIGSAVPSELLDVGGNTTIASNGRVNIYRPTSNATNSAFVINSNVGSTNSTQFIIQTGGSVGIGTETPGRELTIYSPDSGSTYMNLTNATTGAGANNGFALGLGGDEVARIWQYGASQMEFGTNSTQHMTLSSIGQLGIGTNFDPASNAKKLTLICDSVGDGIWIANKENLYSAASTGYSDVRFTFYDYLTGGYTAGGEVNVRARSRNAYASSRTTDLDFMVSPPGGTGIGVTAVRVQSNAKLGIGMNSDQKSSLKGKLDIDGSAEYLTSSTVGVNTSSNYAIVIRNPSTTNTANGIAWTNDSGANVGGAIIHIDKGSNNIGDLAFYTAASSNTPLERLRITSGGNLRFGLNSVAEQTDSAHYIMTLTGKSGQTGAGAIAFKDPSANTDGFIFADDGNLFITADYSDATADSSIRFRVDGSSEIMRIKSTGEVHISDRNTSNTGEHFFQAGAFGIRMEDTGGYNRWNIERNYGGYKSTPIIHLSTQGRVGINTFAPVSTLDLISTEALGSVIQRDFQGATNTTDASSKLALTIWGKNHYDSSYGSTGTDAYGPMIGFGGRVDGNVPNTGDIRAGISYKYNGDLTFHAEAGGNVTDGTNERFRIDGTNGHIITNGGVTELRGGRTYSTNSTSTWSTMLTFSNADNNGFALEIAVAENNYTTMYKVAGTAKWNSVSVNNELAGDTAHLHSKDIEFRVLNDSGTKRLQFKAVNYTTTRYLTVISVWCKSGYVTWS